MSKPVNLNRFRKEKARAEKKARADQNAVTFGLSKAEKSARDQERAQDKRHLDGHERDKS
jgi:hypothetical protein